MVKERLTKKQKGLVIKTFRDGQDILAELTAVAQKKGGIRKGLEEDEAFVEIAEKKISANVTIDTKRAFRRITLIFPNA